MYKWLLNYHPANYHPRWYWPGSEIITDTGNGYVQLFTRRKIEDDDDIILLMAGWLA